MDRKIAACFYRVSDAPAGIPDFPDPLSEIARLPQPGQRELQTNPGVKLRLEGCTSVGNILHGQFVRKQTANIPPSASDAGLAPIPMADGHGLAHTAAFLYHVPTRIMVLQSNRLCATHSRVAAYVGMYRNGALFNLKPIRQPDAEGRLNPSKIREFKVQFASPDNLEALEREGIAAARGAREAAQAYGATVITITVSAGPERKKYLDETGAMGLLRRLWGRDTEATKLSARSKTGDKTEWIDLIDEHIKAEAEIDLPEMDPEAHYRARSAWLETEFRAREEYLVSLFGPQADGDTD